MAEFYISSTKHSIRERQTKNNGKVYDVIFRITDKFGNVSQKKLSGYKTKALAKTAHAKFITEHCEVNKEKARPQKTVNPEKETPTVGELVPLYLASIQNQNKPSVVYGKKTDYDVYLLPKYQNSKITALTKEEMYRWQDELWATRNPRTGDFYSYSRLVNIRVRVNAFLTYCESRYGYKNYLAEIPKPKRRAPKAPMLFWTREEFDKFIATVDDPRMHCLFIMLFFTGRRKGEIFALTPDDVKPDKLLISKSVTRQTLDNKPYQITSTKADKVHEIPLCPIVQEELKNYQGEAPFFFGGDKPMPPTSVTRYFEKHIAQAGVKRIRVHDLRHSFVSMLIHLGANYTVVADLISDTPEQVTKTYGHMYDEDKLSILSHLK